MNPPGGAGWGIDQPKYTSTSVMRPSRIALMEPTRSEREQNPATLLVIGAIAYCSILSC
jgi:hypothetical protein